VKVSKPLQELRHIIAGFFVAYILAIIAFEGLYGFILSHDTGAFGPLPSGIVERIGELAFFSVTTITTIGMSEVRPISGWAKAAVSAELFAGIAFVGFFIGAVLTQLQVNSHRQQSEDAAHVPPA
jgi:hypothetical protein